MNFCLLYVWSSQKHISIFSIHQFMEFNEQNKHVLIFIFERDNFTKINNWPYKNII